MDVLTDAHILFPYIIISHHLRGYYLTVDMLVINIKITKSMEQRGNFRVSFDIIG